MSDSMDKETMSIKEHTLKSPLEYYRPTETGLFTIADADGIEIAFGLTESHALRIVACVNACKGTSTEWLEGYASVLKIGEPISENFDRRAKENAALLSHLSLLRGALEGVLPYMEAAEKAGLVGDEGCHWAVEAVRAALTEVKP